MTAERDDERVLPCVRYRELFDRVCDEPRDRTAVEEARDVCITCPVRASCDALAEAVRPVCGVWGGHLWALPKSPAGFSISTMYGVKRW